MASAVRSVRVYDLYMAADTDYAARHNMTLREFQRLMHSAQMKLMRGGEPLTTAERRVWRFVTTGRE